MSAQANKEILFGGTDSLLALQAIPFKKKEGINNWFDVYEQAFIQLTATDEGKAEYGDPDKGATLEQAWRSSALLTGKFPVCLLAANRPDVQVAAIEKVIRLNALQMISVFKELYKQLGDIGITVFYFDGKIGHSICLLSYDETTSRFSFLDPWPEFSLLSKQYNAAGIDAKRVEKQIWSITSEELQRIIIAAFVFKNYWAAYNGQKFTLSFNELQNSDFWTFFNLNVTSKQKTEYGVKLSLKTGGFKEEVDLSLEVDKKEDVLQSTLYINRDWLLGPPWGVNPYAQDIIRNFIYTMVSPADHEGWVEEMQKLFTPESIAGYLEAYHKNPDADLPNGNIVMVFLGMPETTVPLEFSTVKFSNEELNHVQRLIITIEIDNV